MEIEQNFEVIDPTAWTYKCKTCGTIVRPDPKEYPKIKCSKCKNETKGIPYVNEKDPFNEVIKRRKQNDLEL